jgi:hypothetical protein
MLSVSSQSTKWRPSLPHFLHRQSPLPCHFLMLSLTWTVVLALMVADVVAQCRTNENPYCAGNDEFEAICCTYPNICYWQRGGAPACCAAGQWCLDSDGYQVTPQAQYTTVVPAPAPAPQPTTIYTTVVPQPTPTRTITQQPQPTQQTITQTQQPTQQSTIYVTTEDGQGPAESAGSAVVATASSVINVFEGAAATARPAHHAVPVAGAMALAAWHMV